MQGWWSYSGFGKAGRFGGERMKDRIAIVTVKEKEGKNLASRIPYWRPLEEFKLLMFSMAQRQKFQNLVCVSMYRISNGCKLNEWLDCL